MLDLWFAGAERDWYVGNCSCRYGFVGLESKMTWSRRIRVCCRCSCFSEIREVFRLDRFTGGCRWVLSLILSGEFHVSVEKRVEMEFLTQLPELVRDDVHPAGSADDCHPPSH